MVAEGLGQRPGPKARAKGALDFFGLFGLVFGRYEQMISISVMSSFQGRILIPPAGAFGGLPRRAPSAHCAPVSAFGAVRINS
jgi:hypothetical protein